jgi:hypothetical protein
VVEALTAADIAHFGVGNHHALQAAGTAGPMTRASVRSETTPTGWP